MIEPGVSVPKLLSASSCSIKDDIDLFNFLYLRKHRCSRRVDGCFPFPIKHRAQSVKKGSGDFELSAAPCKRFFIENRAIFGKNERISSRYKERIWRKQYFLSGEIKTR